MIPGLLRAGLFGTVGVALGATYFAALHLNTRLYLASGLSRARAVGLHALRLALLVGVLLLAVHFGALTLLAAFGGMLFARPIVSARIARGR